MGMRNNGKCEDKSDGEGEMFGVQYFMCKPTRCGMQFGSRDRCMKASGGRMPIAVPSEKMCEDFKCRVDECCRRENDSEDDEDSAFGYAAVFAMVAAVAALF